MKETLIGRRIDEFISYKHSIGYVYERQEQHIREYQRYMEEHYPQIEIPDKKSMDEFLDTHKGQTGSLYNLIATLREFSRYLHKIGLTDAYIIPDKYLPKLSSDPPYFFSEEEISQFFRTCDLYYKSYTNQKTLKLAMPVMFRLIYCCGLRPKEARTLLCANVHLDRAFIDIMQSKGPKSRRLYISEELASYLSGYDALMNELMPKRVYFFPTRNDKAISIKSLDFSFKRIWLRAFPDWLGKTPRLYDLRHHFAWTVINEWVREGTDVNNMLPYLMRYMGHNCIKHTLYYFHFVPDFYSDYRVITDHLNDRIPEVDDDE